jgi:hypothetical protein
VTVPRWYPEVVNWALSSQEYHNTPGGHVRIYRRAQLCDRLRRCGPRSPLPRRATMRTRSTVPYWWLRCAIGDGARGSNPLVKAYHRLLVWDITAKRPR